MNYPTDYRQERPYGFSAIGVLLTIVGVIVVMFVVVIASGSVFFPFGGSFEFVPNTEMQTAIPSILFSAYLTVAIPIVVIIGAWVYNRGLSDSESQ